ncbi:MAG: amidohydrolase family protein [Wenzhouxiangellaceae bacterium]
MKITIRFSALLLLLSSGPLFAQTLLIKNARIHTAAERGTIEQGQVLIRDGRIRAVDEQIRAEADVPVYDAGGRALTPGLFGGVAPIGLIEVSAEDTTVEHQISLATTTGEQAMMRPEFNPLLAYNPLATNVSVSRAEGITYAMLAPSAGEGGSIIPGRGALVSLNGGFNPELERSEALFIELGAGAQGLSGNSRAAQYMLLQQAFRAARASSSALENEFRILTASGRETLARFLADGRMVFDVNRAADILQVLRLAEQYRFRAVINGGAEAWQVAAQLAEANVSVILDPLRNLPANFDYIGARLDNAKLLHEAGVNVIFSHGGAHNARKVRQAAGIAVAYGLPWNEGLKAITATPAEVFGQGDSLGTIEPGKQADLVLWSGDPLEVTSYAEAVWIGGQAMSMETRQTKLRDRYLPQNPEMPRQYFRP